LGAITTPLSFNEVYTSLQTKLIDGEASPLATIEAGRFYEINRYLSLTNHAYGGVIIMANGDAWKSLPPDLQAMIERNNTKYGLLERKDSKAATATLATVLAGHGMIVNQVDQTPFRANLRPYYESWQSTFGPTAWGMLQSSLGRKLV
jgi:TRAP-type C4-dicarboxylate transport system substrate-binding protein